MFQYLVLLFMRLTIIYIFFQLACVCSSVEPIYGKRGLIRHPIFWEDAEAGSFSISGRVSCTAGESNWDGFYHRTSLEHDLDLNIVGDPFEEAIARIDRLCIPDSVYAGHSELMTSRDGRILVSVNHGKTWNGYKSDIRNMKGSWHVLHKSNIRSNQYIMETAGMFLDRLAEGAPVDMTKCLIFHHIPSVI